MIDTERSPRSVARLHDEIMRERAEGLREAAQTAKARLAEREAALARLRAQVASLRASLDAPLPRKAAPSAAPVSARPAPMPVPEKEACADSATAKASFLRTAGWSNTRTARWRSLAPYAAIVSCALLLEVGGARRPATAAASLADLAQPAPALISRARPEAKGALVVDDDGR
ncbi:MAG: hypothetical protein NUW21_00995, partial [Elusimicrobia bacterium]|nr:hypothetical protein [Elusimicrobiota bacterium]